MKNTLTVLEDVFDERGRQEDLKEQGRFLYTCADDIDDGFKLACLIEEVGEVGKALLYTRGLVSDGGGNLRKELIHVAAIAVAWVESL